LQQWTNFCTNEFQSKKLGDVSPLSKKSGGTPSPRVAAPLHPCLQQTIWHDDARWVSSISTVCHFEVKTKFLKVYVLDETFCIILTNVVEIGSGAGRGGMAYFLLFLTRETRPPLLPHFFGLKFVQKLVHFCNWLLPEMQCKIISVQHACRPKLF